MATPDNFYPESTGLFLDEAKSNSLYSASNTMELEVLNCDSNTQTEEKTKDNDRHPLPFVYRAQQNFRHFITHNASLLNILFLSAVFLAYLAYFVFCMVHSFGDENSVRLLVCTIVGVLFLCWHVVAPRLKESGGRLLCCGEALNWDTGRKIKTAIKWLLYVVSLVGAVVVLGMWVLPYKPRNLVCLAGIAVLLLVAFLLCDSPEYIRWHTVYWGMMLQFWAAVLVIRTDVGAAIIEWMTKRVMEFLAHTDAGTRQVFGPNYRNFSFVFQVLPTMLLFSVAIQCLYHWGVVQLVVTNLGAFLSFTLDTAPVESVSAAANLFLSMMEVPILIQPYIASISSSELFAVIVGGFASVAGAALALFVPYGIPGDHILAASAMSAPAALAMAKLVMPDRQPSSRTGHTAVLSHTGPGRMHGSLLEAISEGCRIGLKTIVQIAVGLLVYVALLHFLDSTFAWLMQRGGFQNIDLSDCLSYVLFPIPYLVGIEAADCLKLGRILSMKILSSTVASYMNLGRVIKNGQALRDYVTTTNGTWIYVNDDVLLEATNTTLYGGVISERSGIIGTYLLCGFSSVSSMGISVAVLLAIVPSRAPEAMRMSPLALLLGNMANFSTACVAGLLF